MKMVFQAMNPHVLILELLGDFSALHKSMPKNEEADEEQACFTLVINT